MKLNMGCGSRAIPGWFGVDAAKSPAADLVAPADKVPLADGCAEELMAIHLIEHLYRWETEPALAEWARLLKPGGKLIIEAPDVMKCAANLINGKAGAKHPDQLHMWGLYGDPRYGNEFMQHRWGWCFKTLKPLVIAAGFDNVAEFPSVWHKVGIGVRDFRLEATRRR